MTKSRSEARAREVLAEHVPGGLQAPMDSIDDDFAHIRPSEAIAAMLAFTEPAAAMPSKEQIAQALLCRLGRIGEQTRLQCADAILALIPSHSGETGEVELAEAARDLLRALHKDQRTVGYRLDLWNRLQACLAAPNDGGRDDA